MKNEIRLVKVRAGNGSSEVLECDIEHKLLSKARYTYEAISYFWGESSRSHDVLCDDGTNHLKVTSNLCEVLRQLASLPGNTNCRNHWIDSICINQDDAIERGSQVQQMADIYRLSEQVHIFLGVLAPGIDPLQSEWFTRRWVVQEAFVAQKIHISFEQSGQTCHFDGWKPFWDHCFHLNGYNGITAMAGLKFFGFATDVPGSVQHDILDLMYTFHDAKCSDDRDRLFALVGASRDVTTKQKPGTSLNYPGSIFYYKPDYTVTTEQAYRSFAQAALRSTSAFKLLSCAGAFRHASSKYTTSIPSWTPDWRCKAPLARAPDYSCFTAGFRRITNGQSTERRPAILVDETDWSINFRAVHLGKVKNIVFLVIKSQWSQSGLIQARLDAGNDIYDAVGVALEDEVVIPIGSPTPFIIRRQAEELGSSLNYKLISDCWLLDEHYNAHSYPRVRVMNGDYISQTNTTSICEYRII
ncbi:heterokaryon incompatibility protein-domain-containing protein [Alternaria rosae]|uniref:heterokaryon incompatibility protein-domain-containing protein n=1 Tax=Alternaria rosae TaxID=1187941 RepID=UPI001E8E0008|nr:heterokaryon incompatibility protein-domain-containing protein [Alternaria rosae]KAH6875814.1 heterokaryon incompatibility protein-domain-containing protein [Alternaria rosae]